MVIQCPECKTRYRAKNYLPGQPAVRVKCPKCSNVFLAEPENEVAKDARPAVLVVDDARFFREILTELLAPLQIDLVAVGSAAEALAALKTRSFKLAMVDLNLPDMSGLDLLRKIRSESAFAQVKLLAMSGAYRRDDCEPDSLRAGADGFLNKSFKPDELQQKIRDLLEQ